MGWPDCGDDASNVAPDGTETTPSFTGDTSFVFMGCAPGTHTLRLLTKVGSKELATVSIGVNMPPTPTNTPVTPTPTSVSPPPPPPPPPPPLPTDTPIPCLISQGDISGNKTISGKWISSCVSTHRTQEHYARFYSFTWKGKSDVRIELTSTKHSYLYLLQGDGKNGKVLASDDSTSGGGGSPDSDAGLASEKTAQVQVKLTSGSKYTVEAVAYTKKTTGSFKVKLTQVTPPTPTFTPTPTPTRIPYPIQQDHTVMYKVAVTITPGPTVPAGTPVPHEVIPTSVPTAVAAWETAIAAATPVLDLSFCKPPCRDNADNYLVTVKTVEGDENQYPATSNINDDCGRSVACVKGAVVSSGAYLANQVVIFEEPAYRARYSKTHQMYIHERVRWTDISGDHLKKERKSGHVWFDAGRTMIHEFGHALGYPEHYPGDDLKGILNDPHLFESITNEDIKYLQRLYAGHIRLRP